MNGILINMATYNWLCPIDYEPETKLMLVSDPEHKTFGSTVILMGKDIIHREKIVLHF